MRDVGIGRGVFGVQRRRRIAGWAVRISLGGFLL